MKWDINEDFKLLKLKMRVTNDLGNIGTIERIDTPHIIVVKYDDDNLLNKSSFIHCMDRSCFHYDPIHPLLNDIALNAPPRTEKTLMAKIENFETAFHDNSGHCSLMCACGKTYYNEDGGWDWQEGELEKLHNDKNAINVDCSVGGVQFEGAEYANVCDCWHKRAEKIIKFIDAHAYSIAEYLTLEKKRKQLIADSSPIVKECEKDC